ncbi:MAG TPA: hypothetical protein DCR55_03350 [Lentisphaeria bacterium]|jgi:hypothetical protein|nr:hypothetical protein [Lentisphaeria bacterium]
MRILILTCVLALACGCTSTDRVHIDQTGRTWLNGHEVQRPALSEKAAGSKRVRITSAAYTPYSQIVATQHELIAADVVEIEVDTDRDLEKREQNR